MRLSPTSDLWWKNAVIYCLDVETFRDADGDGCGDLAGLIERIDHVAQLGATCVWLMPLYPTPNQDDGYDITDYLGVDPRLGDLGDVAEAIRHANDRGLRVLADLVFNHTSVEHPWFQAARASRESPYRDYYLWTDDPASVRGTTEDNWTWDEQAGQHYMHRFQPFQPDLNIVNPAVREQITKTVGFWLKLGVSGFRMDAVPFMLEEVGGDQPDSGDSRRWLHALREYAGRRRAGAMLMGEVNVAVDRPRGLFRRSRRRAAPPARLPHQPAPLALARPRRGRAAGGPDPPPARAAPRLRLGDVPAQPRRADARQALPDRAR